MNALKIMVTGVYGLIGGAVYRHLVQDPHYEVYGLARRRHPSVRTPGDWDFAIPDDRFVLSSLATVEELVPAFRGIDTIVHMAANPDEFSPWETIYPSNILGARNVFEAARLAGVRRIIYASSTMVNWGYRDREPYKAITQGRLHDVPQKIPRVTKDMPVFPQDIYSCTKVFGEAMCRMYSDQYGLSCLALRIGWVVAEDKVPEPFEGPIWCSQRDIVQLVERCIHAPADLKFDIFYGVSESRYRWVDIEHARDVLGYAPQDRDEDNMP